MTTTTLPRNLDQISKFAVLATVWLVIIFGAVWVTCWLVGVALPEWTTGAFQPAAHDTWWAGIFRAIFQNEQLAEVWASVFRFLTPAAAIAVFIPINAMFMVLAERRALALFTVRMGPNRVGLPFLPRGFLQTAADAFKLLFKEDITPRGADIVLFTAAPIIFFAPSIIGVLPLLPAVTNNHALFQIANVPTGIFYILAVSSIPVVGLVMGSWASNNKYSLVGGLRSAAQAISYEIPLVLAIITVCLMASTLDIVKIVNMQDGGLFTWNIFGGPYFLQGLQSGVVGVVAGILMLVACLLLFGIYLTSACAEVNRIPFDLPEAESELVSGFNTEYSGIKFAIFFLAEFTNLFVVCTIATTLFLGGGHSPVPGLLEGGTLEGFNLWLAGAIQQSPGMAGLLGAFGWFVNSFIDPPTFWAAFWVILKTYTLVLFAILVRATLPRFRIDQLMDFGWKRLIPLSLILLISITFLRELV